MNVELPVIFFLFFFLVFVLRHSENILRPSILNFQAKRAYLVPESLERKNGVQFQLATWTDLHYYQSIRIYKPRSITMTIPALSEYSNGSEQLRPSTTLESITIVIAVSNLSRSEVNNKKAQPPTLQSAFNHRHTVIILMPNYVDQQNSAAAAQSCVQHNTYCLELSMIQELGESRYESQHHYVAKNQSERVEERERERERWGSMVTTNAWHCTIRS